VTTGAPDSQASAPRPHYRWPWFVLGAVVLGIVLAVLWMSIEVARTKRNREMNSGPAQTGKP
jgi:hypothetical protein